MSTLEIVNQDLASKKDGQKIVFISYRHSTMSKEADELYDALTAQGFYVLQDIKCMGHGDTLPEYMKLIVHEKIDKIIMLLDEGYLKSLNCMKETRDLALKGAFALDYKNLIIIPKNTEIFELKENDMDKYWKEQEKIYSKSREYINADTSRQIQGIIYNFFDLMKKKIGLEFAKHKDQGFEQIIHLISPELKKEKVVIQKHAVAIENKVTAQHGKALFSREDEKKEIVKYNNLPIKVLHTLQAESAVLCVAILPHTSKNNDTRIVSGSYDKTPRVWNADSGKCLQVLKGHSYSVFCVTIMPDGRIVSGSIDTTLRIWNADSGECLQVLNGHSGWVFCVAIIPDGRIVSGSDDKTLRIWNADSGKCLQVLKGHSYDVYCVAIMPDGRIVSGSDDNTLRIWNADSGECLQVFKGHSRSVRCIALLQFKYHFVSGSNDKTLRVWNANGECKQILEGHSSTVRCVAVIHDPNRNTIVSGSFDNTLRVWNPYSGECFQVIQGHSDYVNCVAIIPDGRIVSGSHDKTIKIWGET